MKKIPIPILSCRYILTLLLLLVISCRLTAQSVTNYAFTASNGTFTALTSPTAITLLGGNVDDGGSDLIPIGFDFWYMGVHYTQVSASTNGWLALGATQSDYLYTNGLSATGSPRPVIAPLWDDLDIVATTNLTYKTTGTAGSRIFTVQYLNVKWNYLALGSVASFQVRLYEGTGKIDFVYRSDLLATNQPSASIGITALATGTGNFLSVNNAGTSVSSASEANITTKRATGRTYIFTPPVPTAPGSLTFSAVTNSSMTLNWTDLSSNERGFVIYRSTDGVNYIFNSQTAANTTSSVQAGLTINTTYYWKVYAVTEGALSSPSSGSQSTFCSGVPTLSGTTTETCVGGSTGTITAIAAGGTPPYTYSLDTGAYQSSATFTGLAAGTYTLNVKSASVCIVSTIVIVSPYATSTEDQNETGTDTWVGHIYDGLNFANYIGHFTETETFNESFGGPGTCFNVLSNTLTRSIFTETFSVKYKMGSTKRGLYTVNLGSDDGGRLTVDGVLLYNNWVDQSFSNKPNVLFNLNGASNLLYEFFENGGDNQVVFQNLSLVLANTLSTNTIQSLCSGNTGIAIGGDTYGVLPSGITLSGTGYQWSYSTSPIGVRTNITGATGATFTPTTSVAPFTTAGTYYVYRNASLSSTNNVSPNPYVTTNESNAAVITVSAAGQWTGAVSNNWADASNWCSGTVPTALTNVVIPATATNMPSINSSVACNDLLVSVGATLTLTAAGTLNIAGTLTNNGSFSNSGTINFNGTSGQQTFSGMTSFYNLTLSNANGLLLPASVTINNNVLLTAGTLDADNFNIAVKGNWTNNASGTAFTAGTATVTFNGSSAQSANGTAVTTFNNLTLANTTNTVSLNTNVNISGNLSVAAGTFDLSGFTANRNSLGGQLTVANNAILKIGGTNTFPANYATNTLVVASTVEYTGTNQTIANQMYGNLTLSSASGAAVKTFPGTALTIVGNLSSTIGAGTSLSFTAASAITVNGNVAIGAATTFNGGSYTHTMGGNWTNSGIFNGNTSTIVFSGSGRTVSGTGIQNFNNLTVTASLLNLSADSITLAGNLATEDAGSFSQAAGGRLLMTGSGKSISGQGISLDNLYVSGAVSTAASFTLKGNVSVSGSLSADTGTITMSGISKTISGAGTKNFNVLSITGSVTTAVNFSIASGLIISGSLSATAGTATFTGTSSLSGIANLFNATINGTSLQLAANAVLGIAGGLTIIAGTLDVSSSAPNTVDFNSTSAQNIAAITYDNLNLSNGNNKTALAGIIVNNSITINTGTTFIPGAFKHVIYRNWINYGNFSAGTDTIQFQGNATSYIKGNTTFHILSVNNSTSGTEIVLQDNISASIVNMMNGVITTGPYILTITNTRTGNGKLLGNIHRSHSFTTGVPYAFEGPNNTITFSSVTSVADITVSITEDQINDFPFGGSISEEYTITIPAGTYNATLRLDYETDEINGNDESTMALWHYTGAAWAAVGKTANDTTADYVEQSGLTNITGRWTLSDAANLVRWNGSVSSDWNTAANWTIVQGSPSAPPSASDIVAIGTTSFTNQPTISNNAIAKNIILGSNKAVILSLASGGALTTSGNIDGDWTANAIHTINVNNQNLTIGANLNLSDGADSQAINLNIGSGIVHIEGVLTESGNANITFSNTGTLNLHKDFSYSSGIFTPGSGTVVYMGEGNQDIAHVAYNHLIINKPSGLAGINDTTHIQGNLSVLSGELDNFSRATITGDVNIASGAIMENNSTLHIGGNWNNNGTYTATGASIFFEGIGTQTISASTFNNFHINKPVGSNAVLTGDIVITGDLIGTSGTLDMGSYNCNRNILGGIASLGDSATTIISADNPPANFSNYTLANGSTIIFDGTGTQTLLFPPIGFGNLIFRNTGTKTLASPVTINGNLIIESGATFDGADQTLTLNGNWIDSGTFVPATSTILCSGTAKNIQGNTTFNKVTVTGSYTILNDVTFNGLLNITPAGSLSGGGSIHTTLKGDLTNSGTLYTLGTTTYIGTTVQTLSLINAVTTVALTVNFNGSVPPVLNSTSAPQFGYLNINNTGGINPSVGWSVLYALTVGSGASFNGGIATHNLLGSVTNNGTITSNGVLNFIPTGTATVNVGTLSSTGTVVFGGAGAMTLAGTSVSLRNVVISNTNTQGLTPASGLIISNNLTVNSGATLNAGSYTYLVGGNMVNNGTVNYGTSTLILNGAGHQDIYGLSAFNNLSLNKASGSVTLFTNATVNGVLNFAGGLLETGGYTLSLPSSGTITGASQTNGWVNGKLQQNIITGTGIDKTFTIGDSLNYTPLNLFFSNVTTAGDVIAYTTIGDHPYITGSVIDSTKSVNRFWTLTGTSILFDTYDATFNFKATDRDTGTTSNAFVAGRYDAGLWTYPTVDSQTFTSIQATGLTAFAEFQVGEMNIFVKTWDGGAGTHNWEDAANWNRDGVPTATDDVELTGADTININISAVTKNLLLNNPALVLTINAGNALGVSGNFTLTAGSFYTAATFPSVSGTVNVAEGTVGFTGSGPQTIPAYSYYNLTSSGTGNRTLHGSDTIGIAGIFTPGTNVYTTTGSTVDFNGEGPQTITLFHYNNLRISNTGSKTFGPDTTGIAGALLISGAATANAIMNASTISYNGTADQDITAITYYNLDAANTTGLITLPDTTTVTNNLSIRKGTVNIGKTLVAQHMAVEGDIVIDSDAVLQVGTSSDTTHTLVAGGSITNNGTLDMRPDVNSLCNITFNKDGVQTVAGSGTTTSFNNITLDQGASYSNYLDITATGFSAPDGFLTLKNGSFKLNSPGISLVPFTADITTGNFLIPATAGLWIDTGTINTTNMNWTVAGLVKVTGGTMNMGNMTDNKVIPMSTGYFALTGGNLNLASGIGNPGVPWTLDMKGGTMTVNTQGSTTAGIAPFNMDVTDGVFNMSGGTILIQQSGGGTGEHLAYTNLATSGPGFTGGTLQMGNTFTPAAQTMEVVSTNPLYNLSINSANVTLQQTSDLAISNNVIIAEGTWDIDNHVLKIGGSISNNGTFIVSKGTIEMNGSNAQTIPAAAFTGNLVGQLSINNTAGVTLAGTLGLSGVLLVSNGSLHSDGYLTLMASDTQTALIDGSGTGEVLGDVTMQRYLPSAFGYKYYSSPFQTAKVHEFSDEVDLTASFPSFYYYDEHNASSGWVSYTDTANLLIPLQGYAAQMGPLTTAKTVAVTGVVNNHDQSTSVLYNHNMPYTLGFNLVGNPYPSPIDWNIGTGWSRTNIDDALYYFDAGTDDQYTGTYSSYINGASSDGIAGSIIAAMQGFFVHVSDGTYPVAAALTINNDARINDLNAYFHKPDPLTAPLLRLNASLADESTLNDPVVLYFDPEATKAFDPELDALKLMNTNSLVPSLYVNAPGPAKLSICAWPGLQDSMDVVPLGLRTKRSGWVTFSSPVIERIPSGCRIYLYDAKTGTKQLLNEKTRYRIYLEAADYEDRFFLVFNQTQLPIAGGVFNAYTQDGQLYAHINELNGEKCDVSVTNMAGQVILRKQFAQNGRFALGTQYSSGIYIVSFYVQQHVFAQKIFIGN